MARGEGSESSITRPGGGGGDVIGAAIAINSATVDQLIAALADENLPGNNLPRVTLLKEKGQRVSNKHPCGPLKSTLLSCVFMAAIFILLLV